MGACRTRLAEGPLPDARTPIERPRRTTRAIVDVEVPFARLARELDASIPVRVAEERGRDIGVAGYLDTTVDRGPFSFAPSPSGNELVVRTKLTAVARACTSGRGCYASCSPEAYAEVTVAPALGADYALPRPHLAVRLVRGCRVSALGGLLSVDVTPTIEAQLGPAVARAEREIAARLPNVRPRIEREYAELAKPHPLPLGAGCAVVHPNGIVQGPARVGANAVTLRLALLVAPEILPTCPPERAVTLPALASDPSMPSAEPVAIVEQVPFASFGGVRRGASFPTAVVARADGTGLVVRATLGGDICGDVDARGDAGTTADGAEVTLESPHLDDTERARLEGAHVDANAILAALGDHVRAPLKITPERMKSALPALLPALSTNDVTLAGSVLEARTGGAVVAAEGVRATSLARLEIVAKVAP